MPIVTLLTDFGARSPYPASMKAVVAAKCDATLIDISHDVPRHDIWQAAYLLAAVAPHLPAGTVHLAVVDPGVGTARDAVVIQAGGQFFVGPDNGLLLPAARRLGRPRVFAIADAAARDRPPSQTFHGRDIFAPVAADLVRGVPLTVLASPVERFVDLDFEVGTKTPTGCTGRVLYVDPFGNLITNIPSSCLEGVTGAVSVGIESKSASGYVVHAYGDVETGSLVVVRGSDGYLEVAIREGSAAVVLGAKSGVVVHINEGGKI